MRRDRESWESFDDIREFASARTRGLLSRFIQAIA